MRKKTKASTQRLKKDVSNVIMKTLNPKNKKFECNVI